MDKSAPHNLYPTLQEVLCRCYREVEVESVEYVDVGVVDECVAHKTFMQDTGVYIPSPFLLLTVTTVFPQPLPGVLLV